MGEAYLIFSREKFLMIWKFQMRFDVDWKGLNG